MDSVGVVGIMHHVDSGRFYILSCNGVAMFEDERKLKADRSVFLKKHVIHSR